MHKLVKFCKPEHNLLDRSNTIRLGTLEYYRDMDPSFAGIADATEGQDSTLINSIDTSTASPESLAAIGPFAQAKHWQIENIRLNIIFPNCYIWCCSRLRGPITPEQGTQYDEAYTSSYEIKNARQFGEHLALLLMTNITRTAFVDAARGRIDEFSISEMRAISINMFHGHVLYVDEKISTIDEGLLSPYVRAIPQPLRPIFVKPTEFAENQEYRFVFLFEHQRYGSFAVRKDPVDLPVLPIKAIEQIAQPERR